MASYLTRFNTALLQNNQNAHDARLMVQKHTRIVYIEPKLDHSDEIASLLLKCQQLKLVEWEHRSDDRIMLTPVRDAILQIHPPVVLHFSYLSLRIERASHQLVSSIPATHLRLLATAIPDN